MINTKEDFKALVESIEKESWYKQPLGFGIARVSRGVLNPKLILEATFPVVNWNENHKSAAVFLAALKQSGNNVDCTKSVIDDLRERKLIDIDDELIKKYQLY